MILLTEIQYLPPVEYFAEVLKYESLLIEGCENFQKQSYRNRCYILGANKVEELSVPVKKKEGKYGIREAEIDYDQKWLQIHWRSIVSAYGKSPYFEYYQDFFYKVYFKKHKFLFDLNYELLELCFKLTGISIKPELTGAYLPVTDGSSTGIKDLRGQIHPKKISKAELTGYTQVFGKDFVSNLSIIDLLFCEGKNSLNVLRSCRTNHS
jgi:hypothetical protein